MQDSRRYFESRISNEQTPNSQQPVSSFAMQYLLLAQKHMKIDVKATFQSVQDNLQGWEQNLAQVCDNFLTSTF